MIAVNQDPLGKQGQRLVGNNLVESLIIEGGAHRARNTPATVAACNPKDTAQKWTVNSPLAGYVQNPSSKLCFNVDDCGSDLIYYDCVSTGGTCCGPQCYDNMKFNITSNGKLTTPVHPGECAELLGNSVSFQSCDLPTPTKWTYNAETGAISATVGSATSCLTTSTPPPVHSAVNVWARPLSTGDWATVFLNVGANATDVVCDADCFNGMGFTPSDKLTATDLWDPDGTPIPFTGATFTAKALPAEGGSAMYVFAKASA